MDLKSCILHTQGAARAPGPLAGHLPPAPSLEHSVKAGLHREGGRLPTCGPESLQTCVSSTVSPSGAAKMLFFIVPFSLFQGCL